jgi:hypothetical protein
MMPGAMTRVLDYKTPKQRRTGWARRYLIGVPIVTLCHYVGSLVFVLLTFFIWSDNDSDYSLFGCFCCVYLFPMDLLSGQCGLPDIGNSIPMFLIGSIVNALFWGTIVVAIWHLVSIMRTRIYRSSRDVTRNVLPSWWQLFLFILLVVFVAIALIVSRA